MAQVHRHWPGFPYHIVRLMGTVGLPLYRSPVRGLEHLPRRGPAVLMSNHASYFDPYILVSLTLRPISFMAKTELFEGFGGWTYPRLNTFPVRRGLLDRAALRSADEVLARGGLLGIFPEGTRTPDGHLLPAQAGAFAIALNAGAPIVPIGIVGTFHALPRGGRIRYGRLGVGVGPPVRFAELAGGRMPDKRQAARVARLVMAEIHRLCAGLCDEVGLPAIRPPTDGRFRGRL
jgi:1-acyl-sn-glycerol-3-phosphate acyltransferase